jgi:hypothetical protein
VEDSIIGKPAYFLDVYDLHRYPDSIQTPLGVLGFKYDPNFPSFAKINIRPGQYNYSVSQDDSISIPFIAEIPKLYLSYILDHPAIKSALVIGVYNKYGWVSDLPTPFTLYDLVKGPLEITLRPRLKPGKYFLRFAIQAGDYNPTHNSQRILLQVKD